MNMYFFLMINKPKLNLMTSNSFYKFLVAVLFVLIGQVGYSQHYVPADEAVDILEVQIEQVQSGAIQLPGNPAPNGQFQAAPAIDKALYIALMEDVKNSISTVKQVAPVIQDWEDRIPNLVNSRKATLVVVLDYVKNLLYS